MIWFGHGHGQVEPRWLAGLLLLAAATRLPALKLSRAARWSVAGVMLLAAVAVWANLLLPLKLYPVLVSCAMLAVFGYSLLYPPSVIERMARVREANLKPAVIAYTRRLTQIWCVFFIINGALAFITAMWATEAVWSIYTGVISYVLMGALLGGELLYRPRFKRLHHV